MPRDMMKTVKEQTDSQGRVIPNPYDLTYSEMMTLYYISHKSRINALYLAFQYGFILGGRYAKKRKRVKP